MIIYVVANVVGPATDAIVQVIYVIGTARASQIIHDRLLSSIFNSTFRYTG